MFDRVVRPARSSSRPNRLATDGQIGDGKAAATLRVAYAEMMTIGVRLWTQVRAFSMNQRQSLKRFRCRKSKLRRLLVDGGAVVFKGRDFSDRLPQRSLQESGSGHKSASESKPSENEEWRVAVSSRQQRRQAGWKVGRGRWFCPDHRPAMDVTSCVVQPATKRGLRFSERHVPFLACAAAGRFESLVERRAAAALGP